MSHANDVSSILNTLGLNTDLADLDSQAPAAIEVHTPIDGSRLARIAATSPAEIDAALNRAHQRFLSWRDVPAPKDRKSTRLNSSHIQKSRMPSSA